MEVFGMVIDAFAIYSNLANPPDDDAPGANLRNLALYIKCFHLAANGIYMIAQKMGYENPVADQVMLCIDLLSTLANFGIYSAVYIEELDARSWKGYNEELTLVKGADNFLEALAGIGYFTSFTFKEKAPQVTVVGLGCMQVKSVGAIVVKGINLRMEYSKN